MNSKNVGIFITQLRNQKGLTQKQLAEKIGVTSKAISRWECGLGFPDISLLEPLSKELDISIIELLNGKYLTNKKETENEDINTLIKILIKVSEEKRYKTILISYSIILVLILSVLTAIYLKYYFHGYINYFPELFRSIMIVPFNSIYVLFSDGINFLGRNLIVFSKNIFINLGIGLLINPYILMFTRKKKNYIKSIIAVNIVFEIFKWMVLLGCFDIDDIIIRTISGILIFRIYEKLRLERR